VGGLQVSGSVSVRFLHSLFADGEGVGVFSSSSRAGNWTVIDCFFFNNSGGVVGEIGFGDAGWMIFRGCEFVDSSLSVAWDAVNFVVCEECTFDVLPENVSIVSCVVVGSETVPVFEMGMLEQRSCRLNDFEVEGNVEVREPESGVMRVGTSSCRAGRLQVLHWILPVASAVVVIGVIVAALTLYGCSRSHAEEVGRSENDGAVAVSLSLDVE
jgi:hypothetical protein